MSADDTQGPAETTAGDFNPARYLTQIGGKDYLEVKWRLVWLRNEQPDAVIETELHRDDGSTAIFRARVTLPSGAGATGWGQETYQDFGDYIEKAETKALGRALAALGFGTQFCQDFDLGADGRGRVVDSPVDLQQRRQGGGGPRPAGGGGDPATERQIKAIYAIGQAAKISPADVAAHAEERYGRKPDDLSRQDASAYIDWLKQLAPNGGGR